MSDEDVFVDGEPENCPECDGDLEQVGDHGQMQCDETHAHQYTWASYELTNGETVSQLLRGNQVFACDD